MSKTTVAVVKCESYEPADIHGAVERAVDLLGGEAGNPLLTLPGPVLLKPNMLSPNKPEEAVTTHPQLVEAVAHLVASAGREVWVGDSPGRADIHSVAKATGIGDVCDKTGSRLVPFEEPVSVKSPNALLCREFTLAKPVLDAGSIVNLPKLKTHGLTVFTGAVKNLFGCIPGLRKSKMHLRFSNLSDFCTMLVDLAAVVQPTVSIMDAVVGMDGEGPSHGHPCKIGAILASRDPFALDAVAVTIVGEDPLKVPYLRIAREADLVARAGLGETRLERIEVVGESVSSFGEMRTRFKMPPSKASGGLGKWIRIGGKYLSAYPVIIQDKCRSCGACARACPPGAIAFQPGKTPIPDLNKCIRCYCCSEMCPFDAVELRKGLMASLADRLLER